MRFLIDNNTDVEKFDVEKVNRAYRAYSKYMHTNRHRLPRNVYKFWKETWDVGPRGPTKWNLHDMLLEGIEILPPDPYGHGRKINITIRLYNGEIRNAHLQLNYIHVTQYAFTLKREWATHGSVSLHEITLSKDGEIVHEIALDFSRIYIHCRKFTYAKEIPNV